MRHDQEIAICVSYLKLFGRSHYLEQFLRLKQAVNYCHFNERSKHFIRTCAYFESAFAASRRKSGRDETNMLIIAKYFTSICFSHTFQRRTRFLNRKPAGRARPFSTSKRNPRVQQNIGSAEET